MLDLLSIQALLDGHPMTSRKPVRRFSIGDRLFDFSQERPLMGVVNLSLESWYRESVCASQEQAIERARNLIKDGAALVDIGAESTLPDAGRANVTQQLDKLLPVVRALKEENILTSVESYHPEVLDACARAGANVFNLTGMRQADEVFHLAEKHNAAVVLCYVQGDTVRDVDHFDFRDDMVAELLRYFGNLLGRAEACGVTKCLIDPGLGFYYRNLNDSDQRVSYQMDTFLTCFRLHDLGYPILNILPHAKEVFKEDERRAAEPFFAVLALLGGTHAIRTHEVRTVARVRDALSLYKGHKPST